MATKTHRKTPQRRSTKHRSAEYHPITKFGLLVFFVAVIGCCIAASWQVFAGTPPTTSLHYTSNANFSGTTYTPGAYGFNLADIENTSDLGHMPAGVKALVWVGQCNGADAAFVSTVQPYVGSSSVYGYYLMDEPDPTGQWGPLCPIANLKAESDWIHTHDPGKKTFIISMNMSSSSNPSYANTYKPSNSDIDLYGLDPYPCRSELGGCDYTYITKGVAAAEAWGIPQANIVPVYETFGGGAWVDDGGGSYQLPTTPQMNQILSTWASVVPTPAFDYAYSWGSQNGDTGLATSGGLQQVFLTHNAASTGSSGGTAAGSSGTGGTSTTSGGTSQSTTPSTKPATGTGSTSGGAATSTTGPTTTHAPTPNAIGKSDSATNVDSSVSETTAATTAAKTPDIKSVAIVAGSATVLAATAVGGWWIWRFHPFARWR